MGTKEMKDSKLLAPWEAVAWGLGLGCLAGYFGARAFQTECCPPSKYNVKVTTSEPCGSETVEHWVVDSTGVIEKGPPGLDLSSCSAGTSINPFWLIMAASVFLFALSMIFGSRLIEKEKDEEEKEKVEKEAASWKLIDTKEDED